MQTRSALPPASYDTVAKVTRVTTGAELETALADSTRQVIILADGTYSAAGYFNNAYSHDMQAENLAGAVLTSGLAVGSNFQGNGGAIIQGLKLTVSDAGKVLQGACIHVWGNGENTVLADLDVDGANIIAEGIEVRQPKGLVIQRVVAKNCQDHGVLVTRGKPDEVLAEPVLIEDVDISNISRPVPRSSNGTAEHGLRAHEKAIVRRVKVRNCAWSGVWIGGATNGSHYRDLDIDGTPQGVGIYCEHKVRNTLIEWFSIGPAIKTGINGEWASPTPDGIAACDNVTIRNGLIDSTCAGVLLDEGTRNTIVRDVVFRNQAAIGIGDYKGSGNKVTDNDFSGIADTAVSVYHGHSSGPVGTYCA